MSSELLQFCGCCKCISKCEIEVVALAQLAVNSRWKNGNWLCVSVVFN